MRLTLVIIALCWCSTPDFARSQALRLPVTFYTSSHSSTLVIGTHADASDGFDVTITVEIRCRRGQRSRVEAAALEAFAVADVQVVFLDRLPAQ